MCQKFRKYKKVWGLNFFPLICVYLTTSIFLPFLLKFKQKRSNVYAKFYGGSPLTPPYPLGLMYESNGYILLI